MVAQSQWGAGNQTACTRLVTHTVIYHRAAVKCRYAPHSLQKSIFLNQFTFQGIRYFDLRVSLLSHSESESEIRIVHGLYGNDINQVLLTVLEFLNSHPKEVVVLDFNHFYGFNDQTHAQLVDTIVSLFDCLLCPPVDNLDTLTLDYLTSKSFQAIVFYQHKCKLATSSSLSLFE